MQCKLFCHFCQLCREVGKSIYTQKWTWSKQLVTITNVCRSLSDLRSKDNSDNFISSNFPTWESTYLTKHPLFAKLMQKPRAFESWDIQRSRLAVDRNWNWIEPEKISLVEHKANQRKFKSLFEEATIHSWRSRTTSQDMIWFRSDIHWR